MMQYNNKRLFSSKPIVLVRHLVLVYMYIFLLLDLVNGYLLNVMMIEFPLTIGQLIRGIITLIFILEILANRRINKRNQYIYYFMIVAPFMIGLYFIRDGRVGIIPFELVSLVKPLFFLLLFQSSL